MIVTSFRISAHAIDPAFGGRVCTFAISASSARVVHDLNLPSPGRLPFAARAALPLASRILGSPTISDSTGEAVFHIGSCHDNTSDARGLRGRALARRGAQRVVVVLAVIPNQKALMMPMPSSVL